MSVQSNRRLEAYAQKANKCYKYILDQRAKLATHFHRGPAAIYPYGAYLGEIVGERCLREVAIPFALEEKKTHGNKEGGLIASESPVTSENHSVH